MVDASIILADGPAALVELCGISILERLLRTLQRCGIKRAIVLSTTPKLIAEHLAQPSWARAQIEVTVRNRESGVVTVDQIVDVWPKSAQLLLLVRGDAVFDIRLLRLLSTQRSTTALVDSAVPPELELLVASAPNTSRGKFCGDSTQGVFKGHRLRKSGMGWLTEAWYDSLKSLNAASASSGSSPSRSRNASKPQLSR